MLPRPSLVRTFLSMQSFGITIGILGLIVVAVAGATCVYHYLDEAARHDIIDNGQRVDVMVVGLERRQSMRIRRVSVQDPYVAIGECTTPNGDKVTIERRVEVGVAGELEALMSRAAFQRPVVVGHWHPSYPLRVVVRDWEVNYDRWPVFAGIAGGGALLLLIGVLAAWSFAAHVRGATPVRGKSSPRGVSYVSPAGLQREVRTRRNLRRNDPVLLLFETGRVVLAQSVYGPGAEAAIAATLPPPV